MEILFKLSVIFIIQCVVFVNSERTRDKMYTPIAGASCFRRLNGTHQTGCSSSSSGSAGVLHLIRTNDDFDFILNGPPSPPYAPIIPPHLFTRENILKLKNNARENVSVIIVINETENLKNFSHESSCPNQFSGISSEACDVQKPDTWWNPLGTGLLNEDFPFPIYYVADQDEINKLTTCFEKFNNFDFETHKSRSLCSIQINAFMSAAVNSEVCIRRTNFINNLSPTKYCDPLEGKNIYGTLFPRENTDNQQRAVDKNEKFILVSSRLDTTSMFDGVGLGAMDSLISFATMVSAAHMLAKLFPQRKDEELNVLFVVFNGESYDYIGSQRFVYDLKRLAFPTKNTKTNPISLDNIEFMIDIGALDDPDEVVLYTLSEFEYANNFLKKLQHYSERPDLKIKFTKSNSSRNLPPTSAQSFLRDNNTFPAVILNSNPASKYVNKFYHSIYDDSENLKFMYKNTSSDFTALMNTTEALAAFSADSIQMRIRNISSALALALYETISNKMYDGAELASPILVDEFLHCFLESQDCPLFKASSHPNSLVGLPIPPMRYISVQGSLQEAAGWTYRLLGFLLSQKYPKIDKENCTHLPLHWYAGFSGEGECRLTTQNYSHALSPAFLIDNYDWKSGKYSTWTESTWAQFSARIFLRPSRIHETVTLAIGFVVLILSFCLVFLINSRSDVLFENIPASSTISEPAAC